MGQHVNAYARNRWPPGGAPLVGTNGPSERLVTICHIGDGSLGFIPDIGGCRGGATRWRVGYGPVGGRGDRAGVVEADLTLPGTDVCGADVDRFVAAGRAAAIDDESGQDVGASSSAAASRMNHPEFDSRWLLRNRLGNQPRTRRSPPFAAPAPVRGSPQPGDPPPRQPWRGETEPEGDRTGCAQATPARSRTPTARQRNNSDREEVPATARARQTVPGRVGDDVDSALHHGFEQIGVASRAVPATFVCVAETYVARAFRSRRFA